MERLPHYDFPKSLKSQEAKDARLALIHEPHIKPLTNFVEQLREETGFGMKIPYFDPLDGGVNARVLFVFEAPGSKAKKSGFVSRNNPDDSAKNFWELNKEAGLPRELTVTWNIIPWFIGLEQEGKEDNIRRPTAEDIRLGLIQLARLLPLLPNLEIIVLGGENAQKAEYSIQRQMPDIEIVKMMHTSPQVINIDKKNPNVEKKNRQKILEKLQEVVAVINKQS